MNVHQVCPDLCNDPAHVFGYHNARNPLFCNYSVLPAKLQDRAMDWEEISDHNLNTTVNQSQPTSLVDKILNIAAAEMENEPMPNIAAAEMENEPMPKTEASTS